MSTSWLASTQSASQRAKRSRNSSGTAPMSWAIPTRAPPARSVTTNAIGPAASWGMTMLSTVNASSVSIASGGARVRRPPPLVLGPRDALRVILMLVRDEHGLDRLRRDPHRLEPRHQRARAESAVHQQPPAGALDHHRVAATPAPECPGAH